MTHTRRLRLGARFVTAAVVACAAANGLETGPAPVARAAACDAARLTFPVAGAELAGAVGVFGSAEIDAFQFYKVEFAAAAAPEAWSATSDVVRRPARHARLDRWTTDAVPDGRYRLKLTVVDTTAQERCRVVVDDLTVANRSAAAASPVDGSAAAGDAADKVAPAGAALAAAADGAPWPTAIRRAALQGAAAVGALSATAPSDTGAITATGALSATDALTDAAPLTATDGTASTASDGSADTASDGVGDEAAGGTAAADAGARLAARFGWSFALGFAAVAAVMAVVARRARRGAVGARGR